MTHSLDPLFRPRSIAVIGASDDKARIGGRPILFTREQGFDGPIYPVNAKRDTVQGLAAYPSIRDVPGPVDAAVIAVPAAAAVDVVRDCAETGVKSAVIFTAGFAEMGDADAQAAIAQIARDSGMRTIGPNCLGVFNARHGWFGTFASTPSMTKVAPGATAIISQSGAYGSHLYMAAQNRSIGVNYWVTTGNEVDVDVAELIDYFADAPDVNAIMA
ncbi:MAG: CoA-binding protein, partial [Rhodospirillaceae bacterium]